MKTLVTVLLAIVLCLGLAAPALANPFTVAPITVDAQGGSSFFIDILGPGYSYGLTDHLTLDFSTVWFGGYTLGCTYQLGNFILFNLGATIYLDGMYSVAGGAYLLFQRYSWAKAVLGGGGFYVDSPTQGTNFDYYLLAEVQLNLGKRLMFYGTGLVQLDADGSGGGESNTSPGFNLGMRYSF